MCYTESDYFPAASKGVCHANDGYAGHESPRDDGAELCELSGRPPLFVICRIRKLRRSLCSASGWRKAAKLLDELGEMLELTDDFLGAFARLEDFSPLVASAEAKTSA